MAARTSPLVASALLLLIAQAVAGVRIVVIADSQFGWCDRRFSRAVVHEPTNVDFSLDVLKADTMVRRVWEDG